MYHAARRRFDFHAGFADIPTGEASDLPPQRVGGMRKELPMKILHLRGACRGLGQRPFGGRESFLPRMLELAVRDRGKWED